jgi:hypothetical protein
MSKEKITKAQIEIWKKEHAAVFRYKTTDGKEGYFKNVTLQMMDAARSQARVDQSAFKIFLLKNTFLAGDNEILADEKYLLGLFDWLDLQLIKVEGTMEEL